MYSFRYDCWDEKRFPGYQKSMDQLYDRTLSFYSQNDHGSNPEDLLLFRQVFGFMEYYLVGLLKLRYITRSNFDHVFNQLKDIRLIKLLDPKLRKRLNGLTYNGVIYLNPTPGVYSGLDMMQSLQLTLFHELGHIITAFHQGDLEILKQGIYPDELKHETFDFDAYDCFEKGFDLLDEVAVQNVGEDILCDQLKMKRPNISEFKNPSIYSEGFFHTNFFSYREFQEIAAKFARCLSFLHPTQDDDMNSILKKLSKAMFSSDFCSNLYSEFMRSPEKCMDFVMMLICMGRIKKAKYSSFGMGENENFDLDCNIFFKLFDELALDNDCTEYSEVDQKVQN